MIPHPLYAAAQARFRRRVYPTVDRVKRSVGGYGSYALGDDEYACTLVQGLHETRVLFLEMGYRPEPVAALKTLDRNGDTEWGSFVHRESLTADDQHHVHLFADGSATHLYTHYERSWLTHPRAHYRPASHPNGLYDPVRGVDLLILRLDGADVEYEIVDDRLP